MFPAIVKWGSLLLPVIGLVPATLAGLQRPLYQQNRKEDKNRKNNNIVPLSLWCQRVINIMNHPIRSRSSSYCSSKAINLEKKRRGGLCCIDCIFTSVTNEDHLHRVLLRIQLFVIH